MTEFVEPDSGWEAYIPLSAEASARWAERNRRIAYEAWLRLQERDDDD